MKLHIAAVAGIFGLMALTAAASSVSESDRKHLVPMAGASLVKCETKVKRIDCNTCEYNVCRGGSKVWKDSIMRCTDRDCNERRKSHAFDLEYETGLEAQEIEDEIYN